MYTFVIHLIQEEILETTRAYLTKRGTSTDNSRLFTLSMSDRQDEAMLEESPRTAAINAKESLDRYCEDFFDNNPAFPQRKIDFRVPDEVMTDALNAYDAAIQSGVTNLPFNREYIEFSRKRVLRAHARRML